MDFIAFSHGAPSSFISQVCVCLVSMFIINIVYRQLYDNVRQGLDAFPWDPLFTGGVCLGPGPKDNVTGVHLLDAHHHHGPPEGPRGPYVRCPSLLLSAPS